ncbi:hypothetical protein B484DRAFT_465618, partial [Ochromonadaceae sp. CCMP2298]
MHRAKADRKLSSEYAEAKKMSVLKSTTEAAWAFQSWKDSVENEFKTKGLHEYLEGSIASVFAEPRPEFKWVIDMLVMEIDPDARARTSGSALPRPGRVTSDDDTTDRVSDHTATVETPSLQRGTRPVSGALYDPSTPVTEPFVPVHSKSPSASPEQAPEGYRNVVTRSSPESEGFIMSTQMMLAPSVEFYYSRHDQHTRLVGDRERKRLLHEEKIDCAMDLIKATLSESVTITVEDLLATRDLEKIWRGVLRLCGPRSGNEGLAALEKQWAATTIKNSESMTEFLQRVDKNARGFNAYPSSFAKTEMHKIILVREALKPCKHFEKLEMEIFESDSRYEGPESKGVRRRATARATGRKTATHRAPPRGSSKGNSDAIDITCFGCGQYGHPLAGCPYRKKLAAFQKTLPSLAITDKPKLAITDKPKTFAKTTAAAALAALAEADEVGEEEDGEVSGAAVCTEPMEDWLASEHVCVAYSTSVDAPATLSDNESESEDWLTPGHSAQGDSGTAGWESEAAGAAHVPSQSAQSDNGTAGWESEAAGAAHVPFQSAQSDNGTAGWESEAAGAAHVPSQSAQPNAPRSELVVDEYSGHAEWIEEVETDERECEVDCDCDECAAAISCPTMETCSVSKTTGTKPTLVDSGSSAHISAEKVNRLANFVAKKEMISLGDTSMKCASRGRGDLGPLHNIMWAPDMSFSLVSVSAMDKLGYLTVCGGGECLIIVPSAAQSILRMVSELEQDAIAVRAEMMPDRLYHVCNEQVEAALAATPTPYTFAANRAEIKGSKGTLRDGSTAGLNDLQLLHLRTGHSSKRTILAGLKVNAFKGAQTTYATCVGLEIGPCEGCLLGNMRADAIPSSRRTYSKHRSMQEVGVDPVPLSTITIDGGTVVNMGIDYVTKLMFQYEARTDGQQVVTMKKIERDWCEPYGHKIDVVHTDSAKYFVGCEAFQEYCLEGKIR